MQPTDCSSEYDILHNIAVRWVGLADPETDKLIRDLVTIESAVHQSMVIVGPWFEARLTHLINSWLPPGWIASGPSQIFDKARPGLRSRSWDIVVYRQNLSGLPPESFPGSGSVLLPKEEVVAVIDTKTHYSTPKAYGAKTVFNLMNDSIEPQTAFLGSRIRKMLLIARSNRSPAALMMEGDEAGVDVFCLARMKSSPVSDGISRESICTLTATDGQMTTLAAFRESILEGVEQYGSSV